MRDFQSQQITLLDTLRGKASESLINKPDGYLQILGNKNTDQYYYHTSAENKKRIYISKKEMDFIRALAQKNYDQKFLAAAAELERKMKSSRILWDYSNMHDFYQFLGSVYEDLSPARQKLVIPYVMPDEMYIKTWQSVEYTGKSFKSDAPVILSRRGERVRSKSEKIIADMLLEMKLPYRYEYPIVTRKLGTVYPDFTLLDYWNRQIVLLEHFGKMQDADYCNRNLTKIEIYEEEGWHLGESFLFTMESDKHIINMQHFERLIQKRFPWLSYFPQ